MTYNKNVGADSTKINFNLESKHTKIINGGKYVKKSCMGC